MSDRRWIQDRLNFYHWCCMNRPEIVRKWKEKESSKGLDDLEEKDPDRFKWQLAKDKKEIREAVRGMAERMEFSDSSTWPVGAGGKTVSRKFEIVMVFDYRDYHGGSTIHQELFKTIKELGYKIFYVFTDWQNKKVKIMIEKEVKV